MPARYHGTWRRNATATATAIAPQRQKKRLHLCTTQYRSGLLQSPPPNGALLRRSDCRQLQSSGRADEDRPCAGPLPCSIEAGGQGCGGRPARAARASTGCSPQRCQRPTSRPGCARLVRASPKMTPGGPNECGPLRNLAVWERSGDGHVKNGRRTACRSARATPKKNAAQRKRRCVRCRADSRRTRTEACV